MKDNKLTTVTPESVGIPSEAIRNYMETLINREVPIHSFLIMKDEKICAEGYCPPYSEDKLQRIYSISKTFSSMAIGLMADEGKIRLDDNILDYFPEYAPENPHPWLADMTIRDMLKMSTVFTELNHAPNSGPWVKAYLNGIVNHPSGTLFLYDTAASHTLCALVEKLSGKTMLDYMREKFLDEIGFSKEAWCIKGTDGHSWGGSGIMATLRDLAKFASTVMNGGRFQGKQLLPEGYVKEATSRQIFNDLQRNAQYISNGYGYQIWILPDGAFAFYGMCSQYALCFPKQGMIFCCTADTQGADLKDKLIFEELYHQLLPFVKNEPLEENEAEHQKLITMCENMTLPLVKGSAEAPAKTVANNAVYYLNKNGNDNEMNWSDVSFSFTGDEGIIRYTTPRGKKEIPFGFRKHVEYIFPETGYYYEQIGTPSEKGYRAWSNGAWVDDRTLVVRTETLDEYLGVMNMTFSFKGDDISVFISKTAEYFFNEYPGIAAGRKKG